MVRRRAARLAVPGLDARRAVARTWPPHGVRAGAAVGALAFLAFFTKQIALVAVLPALAWLALIRPRAGGLGAGSAVGVGRRLDAAARPPDRTAGTGTTSSASSPVSPGSDACGSASGGTTCTTTCWPLAGSLLAVAALGGVCAGVTLRVAVRIDRRLLGSGCRAARSRLGVGYELAAAVGLLLAAWFSRLHTGGYVKRADARLRRVRAARRPRLRAAASVRSAARAGAAWRLCSCS